ncbi:hypothetical protein FRC19_008767 [Serendipita sp. 401]|nr:hypothetical protein FRC19_008767 [Serendipita sp. 401]
MPAAVSIPPRDQVPSQPQQAESPMSFRTTLGVPKSFRTGISPFQSFGNFDHPIIARESVIGPMGLRAHWLIDSISWCFDQGHGYSFIGPYDYCPPQNFGTVPLTLPCPNAD